MIDIFLNKNTFTYRDIKPKANVNLYPRIKEYLDSVITYFYNSNTIVYNQHILVKLLKILEIDYRWSDIDIINFTKSNIANVIKPLGISNDYMLSIVHPLSTIIDGATEMVYHSELTTILNYREINDNTWIEQSPLKFRNHDFKDLYFNHPSRMIVKDSIVLYDLDIVKLVLMFKYYCRAQVNINQHISIASFIGKYVVTNSIPSMADICILNRYLGKGTISFMNRQFIGAVSVPENTKRLDKAISSFILGGKSFIIEYLRNIELLDSTDAYEFLFIEKYYETSRSKIFLQLTLLDFIDYILNHITANGGNSQYLTKLNYYLRVLANVNINTGNKLLDTKYRKIIDSVRSKL